jgi:hypothetical protein
MLGKMSSLSEVVSLLRNNSVRPTPTFSPFSTQTLDLCLLKVENYAVTEFVQGQTRRWAIAWSFGDVHLPDVSVPVYVDPQLKITS